MGISMKDGDLTHLTLYENSWEWSRGKYRTDGILHFQSCVLDKSVETHVPLGNS